MSPSPHWTLFIARPGRDRQHVIRDPQGEPRIIFGEDDGTRINDRLARYLVESLNAGVDVEDPNSDEGWFLDSLEEGNEQDPAILICDPDFEIRLEILGTGSLEEDHALGRKVGCGSDQHLLAPERGFTAKRFLRRLSNGKTANRLLTLNDGADGRPLVTQSCLGSPTSCQHWRSTKFGFLR